MTKEAAATGFRDTLRGLVNRVANEPEHDDDAHGEEREATASDLSAKRAELSKHVVGEPAERFAYRTTIDRGATLWKLVAKDDATKNQRQKRNFFDLGGRDGQLKILLGSVQGEYDRVRHAKAKEQFASRFNYFGCDIKPTGPNVVAGDLCAEDYVDNNRQFESFFDVVYSNNTFEHLYRPWITVKHIARMLKPDGLVVLVAPFAQRYHKSPDDFFRYSHTSFAKMFSTETDMKFETVITGYDTFQRRMNVFGRRFDALVEDDFGGWRETWYACTVLKRTG
ncbi:class I SAM-dependent methyltransferase [Methylopila henanensis]|uniref:Class I SAM-dependent methyltransferase n=1 Tax=Methylopila henanensis TaxID=873516 RepID=A0ABW4K6S0_9HYPH